MFVLLGFSWLFFGKELGKLSRLGMCILMSRL